jgi:NAD+ kinase
MRARDTFRWTPEPACIEVTEQEKGFARVGIVGKTGDAAIDEPLREVAGFLTRRGIDTVVDARVAEGIDDVTAMPLAEIGHRTDLVIVVGGDGTLLHTARELADSDVRILGINRGRLGFLADIGYDQMHDALDRILSGDYQEDLRFMLDAEVRDEANEVRGHSRALNDVVIHKWNTARMIEFETWIDGRFVDTQRSDGMIVSTPTGSTAYALSGGGPLVSPGLNAILLVPICPHTLSNRPIVVSGDSVLELVVSERTTGDQVHITCDGQTSFAVPRGHRVVLRKSACPVRLIHPAGHDHFHTLRAKLGWGGNRH